jgi:hypothetical protein
MLTTATPAGADAPLEQIARLNDRTRLGFDRNARVVITRNCLERLAEAEGAPEEPIVLQARLMAAFRHCNFSEDSPERDFAAITFLGRKVWMKIDYFDAAMEFGSEDPADASITTRVMTILLPEDY